MREDEVYLRAKAWFSARGYAPIAGQPPNGCDNIPVVEVKDYKNLQKGSKGAFKPDLIVAAPQHIVVVECKPADSRDDEDKLSAIAGDHQRLMLLYQELSQRRLLERRGLGEHYREFKDFSAKCRFCLAHAGTPRRMKIVASLVFSLDSWDFSLPTSAPYSFKT